MSAQIVLVAGTIAGAQYGLTACCISLTYRASRVLNLAQGAVALTAATTFALLDSWPVAAAALVALGVSMGLGLGVEWSTRSVDPLARLTAVAGWLLGIGTVLAMRERILRPRYPLGDGVVEVLGIRIGVEAVALITLAVALPLAARLVLDRTMLGARVVAVADAPAAARFIGLDVGRTRRIVWVAIHALIGVGGILAAPRTGLEPSTSFMLLAGGLAAALVGGLTRLALPVAAGFGLGYLTAWLGGHVIPTARDAIVLCAVIVVLIARRSADGGDAVSGRV
jgi:branched-subunit amino acid ABC-type transport system permease component